ncbi:hypothetical protein BCD67_19650 [Oscillatoriales cyanobacterium USR001]|nr:hypothetical protein BCD67_19650 [Oscillatoriales cyanobacterium USR001]
MEGESGSKQTSTTTQKLFRKTQTAFKWQKLLKISDCALAKCSGLIGKHPNYELSLQEPAVTGGDSS